MITKRFTEQLNFVIESDVKKAFQKKLSKINKSEGEFLREKIKEFLQ